MRGAEGWLGAKKAEADPAKRKRDKEDTFMMVINNYQILLLPYCWWLWLIKLFRLDFLDDACVLDTDVDH